jgi:hypothetical protein
MPTPLWDLHVHAAPSLRPRWGNDLDLVDAAAAHGLAGFVLKSHHESTAGRAIIANAFAARTGAHVRVLGSVTLNPWIDDIVLRRGFELGSRMVWWPTMSEAGETVGLQLPKLHGAALHGLAAHRGVAATGHLAVAECRALIADATALGVPVIVTHPFNPLVGVGSEAAEELGNAGGIIEVDAYSLTRPGVDVSDVARVLIRLRAQGVSMIFSSDGGQAATGEPMAFLRTEAERLEHSGFPYVGELVGRGAALAEVIDR